MEIRSEFLWFGYITGKSIMIGETFLHRNDDYWIYYSLIFYVFSMLFDLLLFYEAQIYNHKITIDTFQFLFSMNVLFSISGVMALDLYNYCCIFFYLYELLN